MKTLGERIYYARQIRGQTLDAVAQAVGVHKSTIQRYEKDEYANPKLPVIESIARVLCVNPSWLIGKSDNMGLTDHPLTALAPALPISLVNRLARLDSSDLEKVEAYADGLLTQDKYNVKSSAG